MALVSESKISNGAGRKIRLHGRVVTEKELHEYILNLIKNENITGTKPLSLKIGKQPRQTKRILDQMAFVGLIEQDPNTGRLIKTKIQEKIEFDENLFKNDFAKIPEIKKFIEKALARGVKPKGIQQHVSSLRTIFRTMKTHPASVIISQSSAEEFFANYSVIAKQLYPKYKDVPQQFRVAYRVFLSSVANISYGHGMAKGLGFGSHHQAFQKYAGCHIPLDVCDDLQKMMLTDKEFLVYTWFCTAIMTGARSGGIASMTWDKINLFKEDFRLDQFETKDDSAGHLHLGEFGEWKHKFPPLQLYDILLKWKNANPQFSKFVWFEDCTTDKSNLMQTKRTRNYVIPKLKEYLHRVENKLDPLTREYVFEAGEAGHLNRHTFAQLMRNAGATDEEIAFAGGWKGTQTIAWYSSTSEKEKTNAKKLVENVFSKRDNENGI